VPVFKNGRWDTEWQVREVQDSNPNREQPWR
jgi:hypothetical protein